MESGDHSGSHLVQKFRVFATLMAAPHAVICTESKWLVR